jgi:predicted GNAT superfamily acetyltransferase
VSPDAYSIRPLTNLDDCRQVVELEKRVWQYPDAEDVVPAAVLLVSMKRGGILLGAFDAGSGQMLGFVYSLAALKDGRVSQWSHMLGVLPERRGAGLGVALKRAQRAAALEMGIALIEWTFDPLQALNAHLNVAALGAVSREYAENLYGTSSSPLHQGTPTDRLMVEWHLDSMHVKRRLEATGLRVRAHDPLEAPVVNQVNASGGWLVCGQVETTLDDRRLLIDIPGTVGEMLARAPALAQEWRMATRLLFTTYLNRGYRVVDFFLDRDGGRGRYLLARDQQP